MKEKLIIRNFGPIKNVELELGRFNVLIGEQATGKSTVAKVLAVCRYFSYIAKKYPNDLNFEEGLDAFGIRDFSNSGSFINYENKHYSFTAEYKEDEIDEELLLTYFETSLTPISQEFKQLLEDFYLFRPAGSSSGRSGQWIAPISFYHENVSKVVDNPFYIPTERGLQSIFSLGKNSIQNISDALYNQFAEIDFIARRFTKETEIEPLNIDYKNVDGRGYIRKKEEDKFYNLFNAASGYQSTIPIVLLIKYYTQFKKKSKTFIIEEPELNLFPIAQAKLMEFLTESVSVNGHSFFINTHSPYVLTTLSNLMYAYKVGQQNESEAEKIIPKRSWLNPDEVSAYRLLPDGTCEDIFDREEDLIKADKIDEISGVLNRQFDALINVELAIHE